MAICKTCGNYYKFTAFNKSDQCEDCIGFVEDELESLNNAYEADILELTNPTGRTLPKPPAE